MAIRKSLTAYECDHTDKGAFWDWCILQSAMPWWIPGNCFIEAIASSQWLYVKKVVHSCRRWFKTCPHFHESRLSLHLLWGQIPPPTDDISLIYSNSDLGFPTRTWSSHDAFYVCPVIGDIVFPRMWRLHLGDKLRTLVEDTTFHFRNSIADSVTCTTRTMICVSKADLGSFDCWKIILYLAPAFAYSR